MHLKYNIVCVNYRKARRLAIGIESLFAQTEPPPFNFTVIDNSCDEGEASILRALADKYPIDLYISSENLGYTKASNFGSRRSKAEFIVLMSPDIILEDKLLLKKCYDYLKAHPDVGVMSPGQINDDGSVSEIRRRFPTLLGLVRRRLPGRWAGGQEPQDQNAGESMVEWLQSSFVFIRQELWTAADGLDERYFLFMADIEICREAWTRGYRVTVFNGAVARADGIRASSGSFKQLFTSRAMRIHVRDALTYFVSHGLSMRKRKPIGSIASMPRPDRA